jgi:hypothetical protein
VKVVERYAKTHAEGEKSDGEQLNVLLHNIGISNPVTRASAGATYHQALARELASFLQSPLEANGGMLVLSDVFCLFNRARGLGAPFPFFGMQQLTPWVSFCRADFSG